MCKHISGQGSDQNEKGTLNSVPLLIYKRVNYLTFASIPTKSVKWHTSPE